LSPINTVVVVGSVKVANPLVIDPIPELKTIFPLVRVRFPLVSVRFPLVSVRFPDVIVVAFRLFVPVPVWLIIPVSDCPIFWFVENTGLFIVGVVKVLFVSVFVVLSPINTVVVVGSVKVANPLVIVLFP
jgi:hypothetical protein